MKHFKISLIFLIFYSFLYSQNTLEGKLFFTNNQEKKEYITGASIESISNKNFAVSDSAGYFTINVTIPGKIVLKQLGFIVDTIFLEKLPEANPYEFELKPSKLIKEVVIEEKINSLKRSNYNTINIENIGSIELKKAACCNLAESFETNNSVDIVMSDGVSGAKQVSMLGLDGIYTQISAENIPLVKGLNSSFGLSLVPGTWISSIDISKGTGSVVNGFEGLSGIINVEFLKPDKSDVFFANVYQNSLGRTEANFHLANKINEKTSNILFLHYNNVWKKNDNNNDDFIDVPIGEQLNIFDKWKWQNNKFMIQAGAKAVYENKNGGQLAYNKNNDRFGSKIYGIEITNKQIEAFSKAALLFPNKPYKGLGWINNMKLFEQNLVFGNKQYFGSQQSFYSNVIYQDIIGDTRKKYKTGASFISDYYNQNYNDSIFRRQDLIPGIFGEFEFDNIEKISFSLGARADYYNKFGLFYTPKFNLRYSISSKDVVRLTFGKGTRIANVFMDNTGIFANQRQVKVLEDLRPESGYTYGLSYAKNFSISGIKFDYYFDLFRTQFVNQVVLDYFEKYDRVYVYNLKGSSYSNTFQTEIQANISKNFEARFGYKFYDIKTDYLSGAYAKPMVSRNRFLLNLAYKTRFEKWKFDFTTRYLGKARMPVGENHLHSLYHYENFSQGFFVLNSQVTKKFKFFDVYLGGENLLNYIQSDAIVSNEKPFSDIFDATMVWGPIAGRVIYAGFRYSIK
jgi:hypothetical protein